MAIFHGIPSRYVAEPPVASKQRASGTLFNDLRIGGRYKHAVVDMLDVSAEMMNAVCVNAGEVRCYKVIGNAARVPLTGSRGEQDPVDECS